MGASTGRKELHMDPFQATIYGVVQGLAWFIPISSDAHLEITSVLLSGHDIGAPVTAVIQWGTWVACVLYFWKDLSRFAQAFFHGIWNNRPFATQDAKLAWMLLVGTVPIGVLGVLCKHYIETEWRRLIVVGAAAIVFALVLAAAEWFHRIRGRAGKPEKNLSDIGWGEAMFIGIVQCVALVPGASRSGTTISAGIFAGMSREAAARFSFLLSLPAVLAAGLYELYKWKDELLRSQADILNLVIATVVAGVVGYAAIWFLLRYLKTHTTWVFIGYRLVFGAALLAAVAAGWLPNQPPKEAPSPSAPTAFANPVVAPR
jgi:undecaprenyl-diphosphatase